ncbi:MAG: exosortase C-terminal domain/associated protein EpsI [Candidatus Omnitrophota bacterium]
MAKKILVYAVLAGLLCTAVFFKQAIMKFKELPSPPAMVLNFPAKFDGYESEEISLDEKVYDILNTRTIFLRKYYKEGEMPVWFLVVYGEEDRQSFHPPEYCYLGGGDAELIEKKVDTFDLSSGELDVNKMLFKMSGQVQLVCYWYTAGKTMTASYYKQQMMFVAGQIKGEKTGGTLMRISTIVLDAETEEAAKQRIIDFLNSAMPKVKEVL